MALVVVLGALLAGEAFTFDLAGRGFVVSWIDLAAIALGAEVMVAGLRERRWRLDVATAAYVAFLAVVLVQVAVRPQPLEILGGSSRFLTAALVLAGLTRLGVGERWRTVLVGWGAILGTWVLVELALALGDPALDSFYAVKNAIVTPLGASNTLGGYLVVPAAAGAVLATRDRRFALPALLAGLGVVATMSRGAVLALVLALVGVAAIDRTRRVVATAAGATAVVVLAGLLLGAVTGSESVTTTVAADQPATVAADGSLVPLDPVGDPTDDDLVDERLEGATTSSPVGRLSLWRAAARAFADQPLLGVGLNRMPSVTADLRQPHDHAHNLILHALAESGLLGTLAYLAIWGALALRLWRAEPDLDRLALGAGALALLLHAQVEALTYQRGIETLLAVLLALAATLPTRPGLAEPVREWRLPGTEPAEPRR